MRKAGCWLLLAGTSACTPVLLVPGRYAETPPAGAILYVGQSVKLRADHTFTYYRWSDDLASSRYGAGTYQLTGRKLLLAFATQVPSAARAQAQALAATSDSLHFTFRLEALPGASPAVAESLPFAAITAYDAAGRPLATTVSDSAGRAQLRLPPHAPLALFKAASLGFVPWQQAAPGSSMAYLVQLPVNQGLPYPAGLVKTFRIRQLDGQPALETGQGQQPLRWQPSIKQP